MVKAPSSTQTRNPEQEAEKTQAKAALASAKAAVASAEERFEELQREDDPVAQAFRDVDIRARQIASKVLSDVAAAMSKASE